VVPVDEQGGAHLELGATARELHHDLGLPAVNGGDETMRPGCAPGM